MSKYIVKVREMTIKDLEFYVNYWLEASPEHLIKMGVDVKKRPKRDQLIQLVSDQFKVPIKSRKNYYLTWLINNEAVGYSNINQIEYGKQAFMHLHLWKNKNRQKGLGTEFIKKSLPFYFDNFDLDILYCEPYALNLSPNGVVRKVGFQFVKQYITTPGASNFEQEVKQWKFSRENYEEL